ncbi:DUF6603 domain-containing protein [Streptomyces albipurpureus]|uniref:DUF6603 domain-containing protein n=1 Tax=Streptomyces albipurpureus TaxID=2897419 RepID=A0ABT0V118_9ACTN|nr:DUF6603 domain-containing protein [Streptomyces sp. CWNU-1]MCM2393263.1 hypothetical protein [Streptomyces sp. CWNU-1]
MGETHHQALPRDPRHERDLLERVWREIQSLVRPLLEAAGDPGRRHALTEELGWDLVALGEQLRIGDPARLEEQFDAWLAALKAAYAELDRQLAAGLPGSLEEVKERAEQAGKAAGALKALPPVWQASAPDPRLLPALGEDLVSHLAVRYLSTRTPALYHALVLLGLVEQAGPLPTREPMPGPPQVPVRLAVSRDRLRPDRIRRLLTEPEVLLGELYPWRGDLTNQEADATAALLFPRIAALLNALGLDAGYGAVPGIGPVQSAASAELTSRMLGISGGVGQGSGRVEWGAGIALSPKDRGGLGVVVLPWGELGLSAAAGGWNIAMELAGGTAGFAWGPQGLVMVDGPPDVRFALTADRRGATGEPAWTFGAPTGTRVELGRLSAKAFAEFGGDGDARADWGLSFDAAEGAVRIAPSQGDADSFLRRILPDQGLVVPFDLGLAWSRRNGLALTGRAGLETSLPLHIALGPLTIDQLHLALRVGTPEAGPADPVATVEASVSARLALGPVLASVERLGLKTSVAFPPGGGNAGPMHLTTGFKLPSGIALSVDSDLVSGGGYLSIDQERGSYAGAAQLRVMNYQLSAVGLLNTRQADGRPLRDKAGRDIFSLLVIASGIAPAPPSPGFALEGLGVLVGLHRAADADALRAGVRTKALDSVLFPADPVANGPQIVASLSQLFPVAPDRYLLGLMARITWGPRTPDRSSPSAPAKALAVADLALFVELPAPVRIGLLARVTITLPAPIAPVVVLRMDAVGLVDLGRKEASLDASLVESSVAGFPVTGDMALRASWGAKREFTLSIGGFHPRFTGRPKNFPALRRVAISLAKGDNPRVRVEGYLAVTSNTVQHGAQVDVKVEKAGFTVLGRLGYDALIQFSPFGFIVDIHASASVKRGSRTLLAIDLALQLSGPSPWHAKGRARIKLWFVSVSVGFEITAGRSGPKVLPEPVDPTEAVLTALADPAAWSTVPPAGQGVVSLRQTSPGPGEVLAHPLGGLTVAQQVLPLGLAVRRIGTDPLAAPTSYDIAAAACGEGAARTDAELGEAVRDWFAPAQYRELADAAKLSSASFEQLRSGVGISIGKLRAGTGKGPGPAGGTERAAYVTLGYEPIIVDGPGVVTAASAAAGGARAGARHGQAAEPVGDGAAGSDAGSGAPGARASKLPATESLAPGSLFALAGFGPAARARTGSRFRPTAAGIAVGGHTWQVGTAGSAEMGQSRAPAGDSAGDSGGRRPPAMDGTDTASGSVAHAAGTAAGGGVQGVVTDTADSYVEAWDRAVALQEARPADWPTAVRAPGRAPRVAAVTAACGAPVSLAGGTR